MSGRDGRGRVRDLDGGERVPQTVGGVGGDAATTQPGQSDALGA